jgi:hypothetical protein
MADEVLDPAAPEAPAPLPDYQAVLKEDPDENPNATPMSPLYDAYQQISNNYAKFLESPGYAATKAMTGITYDPAQTALLHNFANSNPMQSVGAGILQGFLQSGANTEKDVNAGMGAFKQRAGMEKDIQDATHKVLTDPTVVRSRAQLAAEQDAEHQFNNLLNSGTKDKNGNAVVTGTQLKAYASSILQMVRPGARVSDNGDVVDNGNNVGNIGDLIGFGAKLAFGGNQISITPGDLLGMRTVQASIKASAIQNHNEAVKRLAKEDSSMYTRPNYEALLLPEVAVAPPGAAQDGGINAENAGQIMDKSYNVSKEENKKMVGKTAIGSGAAAAGKKVNNLE